MKRCGWLVAVITASTMIAAVQANAALKHRYSFTDSADDSVGGANGMVVDAGTAPNYIFSGGQLDLSANVGQGSNGITEDAYVDLPNGIVSGAVNSGVNGAISFEFWATVAEQRTWQRFGDFGTSNGGEDTSPAGDASAYVLITPNSGRHANGLEITNHPASNAGEPNVGLAGPFPVGSEHHVVAVYDHNDTSGGANGTMSLYYDGGLVGSNEIHADLDMRTMVDNNNWLGRSQWNDAVFDGSYNEFRIYDEAVSSEYVARSFAAGPNVVVPEPATVTLLSVLACLAIPFRRRLAR
ncbi:MAG: LamG domain-containing protein [Planctomycetales bacterium]|nr:LamG domain-containing protein [Planctomycetales bacterium]